MSRVLILLYGIGAYFIAVAGLVAIVVVLADLMPWGFLNDYTVVMSNAFVWNIGLITAWGIIHTGMARGGFKKVLTKIVPEPAERATYCLVAGITSILLVGCWQPLMGQVWHFENSAAVTALWSLFVFAWVFLLWSTFAINHFDLFGLRQVYINFKNQQRPPLTFVKRAMYRYIRHPIQSGVLLGVWATPSMSEDHLVLAVGFTVYIFVGLWFEERDLIREHGDDYRQYMQETGKVLPKFGK